MPEPSTSPVLTLFSAPQCHLCELAEEVVLGCRQRWPELGCHKVDISGDAQLLKRYGLRIPVVRTADGRELGWPFSADDLLSALEASGSG